MADEIAKYTGKNNVQDFDGYFDKIKRYPTPAGALQGYFPVTDGNGQMILRSFTEPGSEGEANANIAPLEDGPTASQAYAVGGLMVYQGQLMTVLQAIEQGGAITPGTNVMSYTVAQALQQKANQAAVNAALAGKLNVIGKGINLLDNAYFIGGGSQQGGGQLPINERGQTSYSSAGYGINRWEIGASVTAQLLADGLNISNSGSSASSLSQAVDAWRLPSGNTATLSLLADSLGGLVSMALYDSNYTLLDVYNLTAADQASDFVSWSFQAPANNTNILRVYFYAMAGATMLFKVAKLELGSGQTAAHQDSNGNWLPSDPSPDYGIELIKCATSRADPSDTYANKSIVFQ